jgi:hypothetical protein
MINEPDRDPRKSPQRSSSCGHGLTRIAVSCTTFFSIEFLRQEKQATSVKYIIRTLVFSPGNPVLTSATPRTLCRMCLESIAQDLPSVPGQIGSLHFAPCSHPRVVRPFLMTCSWMGRVPRTIFAICLVRSTRSYRQDTHVVVVLTRFSGTYFVTSRGKSFHDLLGDMFSH